MAALFLYAIPTHAYDPLSRFAKEHLQPHIRPYVLSTSQWQMWNLFAPDPLRAVTFYRIEKLEEGTWTTLSEINNNSFSPFRHSAQFKVFDRAMEYGSTQKKALRKLLLSKFCKGAPKQSMLRLKYKIATIPQFSPIDLLQMSPWIPEWTYFPDVSIRCP
jgi:hypothetical protein